MITRRRFLGSVIGLWAGFDFFARTILDPPQTVPDSKIIEGYNLLFHNLKSRHLLRAPGIKDIESKYEQWKFIAHDLNVTKEISLDYVRLEIEPGLLFNTQARLFPTINFLDKAKFTCNYTINFQGSGTDDLKKAIKTAKEWGICKPITTMRKD